jgi:hypothetical protein
VGEPQSWFGQFEKEGNFLPIQETPEDLPQPHGDNRTKARY